MFLTWPPQKRSMKFALEKYIFLDILLYLISSYTSKFKYMSATGMSRLNVLRSNLWYFFKYVSGELYYSDIWQNPWNGWRDCLRFLGFHFLIATDRLLFSGFGREYFRSTDLAAALFPEFSGYSWVSLFFDFHGLITASNRALFATGYDRFNSGSSGSVWYFK